jgi:prepilin-type N-terminal cleavage/methylation domain-containing protein
MWASEIYEVVEEIRLFLPRVSSWVPDQMLAAGKREKVMERKRTGRGVSPPGFTLIELLVVVAIIALLISILLPTLNAVRERSKKTACMANLHALGEVLVMYAQENSDRLPNLNPVATVNDPVGTNQVLVYLSQQYARSGKTFYCPSDANDRAPAATTNGDYLALDSARTSYDFYSVWWQPEYGPLLPKIEKAPLSWDLDGGNATRDQFQNHGTAGGNVVYGDGHGEWQARVDWDDNNWPHPASLYYQQ